MNIRKALFSVGGAVALSGGLWAAQALAGHPLAPVAGCSGVGNCDTGTAFLPAPHGHDGPMTIQNRTPYDYLDSIHFQRSPHVSITRIHGMTSGAGLSDAPIGFKGRCHPQSTVYCRTDGLSVATGPAQIAPSPLPHPQISTPPIQSSRVVAVGRGFDASKFVPRVYGDPYTITPGIAHVPTSIVDRDPYRAQQVLDSGRAVYNPLTPGGVTPALAGVPVNTTPVPPPLPPHYAPRGGHVSGYMTGYTRHQVQTSGHVGMAPPMMSAPPVMSTHPAPVTCRHPGRYPAPGTHPVSPCAKAVAGRSRY